MSPPVDNLPSMCKTSESTHSRKREKVDKDHMFFWGAKEARISQ
jgi:hypothetical protein